MLAVVLAGGDLELSTRVIAAVARADLIIAADSGLRHAAALGCQVHIAVGDFDSSAVPLAESVEVVRFESVKDQTDTHLAVREAVRRGAAEVTLLGALRGARWDHALANVDLLGAAEFRQIRLRAVDGADELRIVRSAATIEGRTGDIVTLLAVTARADGVTTRGLRYPLHGETLRRGDTRGVSNELLQSQAEVRLERGLLLLVHREGGDPNRLW
jgi:thiamine pyrophosphokinase